MPTSFDDLPLRPELRAGLVDLGFETPTPIQAAALPAVLAGRDVTGQARTGSGKTAAFGLGLLQQVDLDQRQIQALVMCPTRELALQVAGALRDLARRLPNTRVITACGGRPLRDQRQALGNGGHVLVGTPGRLAHLLRSGHLDLAALRVLVLDEADRMLDMGFSEQVEGVVAACPAARQTLLFSATFPEGVAELSARTQADPAHVQVEDAGETGRIAQRVYRTRPDDRAALVARLLAAHRPARALVFCETRADCGAMAEALTARGAVALALHGELDQRARDEALLQLTHDSASVLVATDVAARGLDIPDLPLVVVAELSHEPERHVHRVGRTGRAGAAGLALSVVARPGELRRLERIEAFTGQPVPRADDPGGDGDLSFLTPPNRLVLILAGRRDKLRKGDVLGALVKDGGLPPDAIGRIDLLDRVCAVAVRRDLAARAAAALRRGRVKGKRVRARVLGG